MKIPAHIIGEKKRREVERRREEAKRAPAELPRPGAGCRRPANHNCSKRVVVIQM
ncbi:MAG TPA: hypothetical protein PLY45_05600 [bacterium]|nr:hypothetical protein [bacterium]